MSTTISCPVCNEILEAKAADTHVNTCLDKVGLQEKKSGKRQKDWSFMSTPPLKKKSMKDNDNQPNIPKSSLIHGSCENFLNSLSQTNGQSGIFISKKNITFSKDTSKSNFKNEYQNNIDNKSQINANAIPTMKPSSSQLPLGSFDIPLAELVRPREVGEMVGQPEILKQGNAIRRLIETCHFISLILWGPPGCGKTTLARVIAHSCSKQSQHWRFMQLSATNCGTADVRSCIETAKNDKRVLKRKTVLFIDEIHRFNKTQQDTLLACIEDGTIIFIGATTENPSFQVNNALLSRCKVVVMEKLSNADIENILVRTMAKYKGYVRRGDDATISTDSMPSVLSLENELISGACGKKVENFDKENNTRTSSVEPSKYECDRGRGWVMEEKALEMVVDSCDGDARKALNCLQALFELQTANRSGPANNSVLAADNAGVLITVEDVKNVLMKSIQYDNKGDEHYNAASALQKSIRGSDDNAAIYWLSRMLEGGEDALFIARRLVVCASEDVGLADTAALPLAVSTFQACHFIGMPECAINLAHCTTYLARANKSNDSYAALQKARDSIRKHKGALPAVPLHLRNAPTRLMRQLGYHQGYKNNHHFDQPVKQTYLPDCMLSADFFANDSSASEPL